MVINYKLYYNIKGKIFTQPSIYIKDGPTQESRIKNVIIIKKTYNLRISKY